MKLLLDTHVFIEYFASPEKVRRAALDMIELSENEVFISAASVWEIAIKASLKKLDIPGDLSQYVRHRMLEANFTELPISIDHAAAVRVLPARHMDPFDRMLVAQAQVEGLALVTRDKLIEGYGVRCVRA